MPEKIQQELLQRLAIAVRSDDITDGEDPIAILNQIHRIGLDVNSIAAVGRTILDEMSELLSELQREEQLDTTVAKRAEQVVEWLLNHQDVRAGDKISYLECSLYAQFSALYPEEQQNPCEILDRMLHLGWDPNTIDNSGNTLLHHLCGDETLDVWPQVEAIEWLLSHDANVNAQNCYGLTALHLAALTGFGVVISLLENGADKYLRSTAEAKVPLYAARGLVTIPAGSSAYDLAVNSELGEDDVAALQT
jgi:ankyrin repeat protein